jgi:SPP1 family predicted phage head-tail adaptor
MRPEAGRRDTLITFMKRTSTQGEATGARTYSWSAVAPQEWAEVHDILPSRGEQVSEGIDIARRPCRIRTLYRADINRTMRVTFDGRTLEIISGPVEMGRRDGLEMMCQELSTQGEAP